MNTHEKHLDETSPKKNYEEVVVTDSDILASKRDNNDSKDSEKTPSNISVLDTRKEQNEIQITQLTEAFKKHKVHEALQKSATFLGEYSSRLDKLEIHIVDGQVGIGQVIKDENQKGNVLELALPSTQSLINVARENVGTMRIDLEENQIPSFAKEVGNATVAQVAIHEGVHGLLDSTPDSLFAQNFEEISGIENEKGEIATLLDEGFAYAIGDIFAPQLDYGISLESSLANALTNIEKQRYRLGVKLRPMIEGYLLEEKQIDKEFMQFAAEQMKNVFSTLPLDSISETI